VLSSPEAGHRLLRWLSGWLRSKDERLIEFGALTVRQRLIAELHRLSRGRADGERVISPPPAQHILAARVGTLRESVSREMAEMTRFGLLTVERGGIVLHRPEHLRTEIAARLAKRQAIEKSKDVCIYLITGTGLFNAAVSV
jgi:CRP/FNR family cyclic AMP-dependent transcriptional regulator